MHTQQVADGLSTIRRSVLPGGLRVITEALPSVRSVAFGIWAGVGSCDEDLAHAGATHYLEHLLFKGTRRRTALEISAEMDAVGGELNAFTGKEYTCYYARVLDADLPLAIDVLSDMVTSSLIEPKDVDAERGVILEEIAMNDDDPSDTVHEAFVGKLFGDTPLGRPILGTVNSINTINRDADRRALPDPVHPGPPGRGRGGQPRPRHGGGAGRGARSAACSPGTRGRPGRGWPRRAGRRPSPARYRAIRAAACGWCRARSSRPT